MVCFILERHVALKLSIISFVLDFSSVRSSKGS